MSRKHDSDGRRQPRLRIGAAGRTTLLYFISLIVVSAHVDEVEALGVSPRRSMELHAKPVRVAKLAESVEEVLGATAMEEDVLNDGPAIRSSS